MRARRHESGRSRPGSPDAGEPSGMEMPEMNNVEDQHGKTARKKSKATAKGNRSMHQHNVLIGHTRFLDTRFELALSASGHLNSRGRPRRTPH